MMKAVVIMTHYHHEAVSPYRKNSKG